MRHFGIFSNSGDVQTAISAGTLVNPYVALVSGALDYNSVVPVPPTPPTPSSAIGLTVITSNGSVYNDQGDEYGGTLEFTKPYDATFTVYWNGEVATTEGGGAHYTCCMTGDGDGEGEPSYAIDDWLTYDSSTTLEDLDYGCQIGEQGDVVTVMVVYSAPTQTGCGEDEPFDEPCLGGIEIDITNENCYDCQSIAFVAESEEICECAGGVDDGEGNCDCGMVKSAYITYSRLVRKHAKVTLNVNAVARVEYGMAKNVKCLNRTLVSKIEIIQL